MFQALVAFPINDLWFGGTQYTCFMIDMGILRYP